MLSNCFRLKFVLPLVYLFASGTPSICVALEPNGISFGSGWVVFPSVKYGLVEDTNPYLQNDDNVDNATVTKIRPEVELKLDSGVGLYSASYWLEQGAYSTNANDNYTDQFFGVAGERSFGRQLKGASSIGYKLGHDARGAGVDEGITALEDVFYPDEYRELTFDASVTFGSKASMLGFQGYTSILDKNYLNNYDRGTADREYEDKTIGAVSYIYVSPITDALFEIRHSRVDYPSDSQIAQDKEGNKSTYFVGARWDVSGKTTGSIKIGQTTRSFDSDEITTNESFSWEVALDWSPKSYSTVTLETSRGSRETSGPGVFVLSNDSVLTWKHRFSVFFSSELEAAFRDDEFYSASDVQREDNTLSLEGALIYSPSRSMDLGFSFTRESRDSDLDDLDYMRNIVGVELTLAI